MHCFSEQWMPTYKELPLKTKQICPQSLLFSSFLTFSTFNVSLQSTLMPYNESSANQETTVAISRTFLSPASLTAMPQSTILS